MLGSLYSGITGMDAAETGMDVIGHNIANVQTTAFKSGTVSFASVYADSVSILGGNAGNEQGKGVQVVGLGNVWADGSMESTENDTDCAIQGNGFFGVEDMTSLQRLYTRDGAFKFDLNNILTDRDGRAIMGYAFDATGALGSTETYIDIADAETTMGTTYSDWKIGGEGIVTGLNDTTGARDNIFQMLVYDFSSIDGLTKMTGNLYEQSNDSGTANPQLSGQNGMGTIQNSHLESSNVNLAVEFVNLITTQKAFQANSRVISSSADMLTEVINIIR